MGLIVATLCRLGVAGTVLWLAGCAGPTPVGPRVASPDSPTEVIYAVRRSWHTDIGFRASDLHPPLASVLRFFPGAKSLVFGFGDRHYVLSKDKNFLEMVAAMFPGKGLILATGLSVAPQGAFGDDQVVSFTVTASQGDAVQAFVWSALQHDASGVVQAFAPGPYTGALYFASPVSYDFAHTCNTWTAEGLRAGSLPVGSFGVVFASQLWSQVLKAAAAQPASLPGPSRSAP